MERIVPIVALVWAAVLSAGLNASAATVSGQDGSVFVNDGAGFLPVSAGSEVKPTSQIMVSPGASALITYASDCAVKVAAGIWRVQQAAPCAKGVNLVDFTGRMNAEQPPAEEVTSDSNDNTMLVVGGLVVAGAVTAAVLLNQDDDNGNGGGAGGGSGSGSSGGGGNPVSNQ